ncbi:hypothetical protein EON79_04365 [bacterium]|nr:MAG: hypothetical protein EON79_04365 [bacterium]
MNRFLIPALVLAVPALGLAAQDPFDYHCSDITILQAKPVQKELGINEGQRKQMNSAATKHQAVLNELDKQYKGKQVSQQDMKKINPQLEKAFFALKKDVCAILSASQLKRLRELNLQRLGYAALNDSIVGAKIGMSPAQIKQYQAAFISGGQQAAKLQQDTAKPILEKFSKLKPKTEAEANTLRTRAAEEIGQAQQKKAPQLKSIEMATQKKMDAVLTAKQKAAWKALLGKPFKPA